MEWISVKFKLPEDDRQVLTFHDPYIDIRFYCDEDGTWRDDEWIDCQVSYWMELPAKPKDE